MIKQREYKVTGKQAKALKIASKKGITTLTDLQRVLRKQGIPVSRQAITKWRIKAKIGKRLTTGVTQYWKDVKSVMEATGAPRQEASDFVGRTKKWASKRAKKAGKHWSAITERQKFWREWKKKWRKATEEEKKKMEEEAEEWKEEEWYGDTPQ